MKTFIKTLILSSSVSVFLFSCSSSNFSNRKYTDFKNGNGQSKNLLPPKSETKTKVPQSGFKNEQLKINKTLTPHKKESIVTEKLKTESSSAAPFLKQSHENADLRNKTEENKFQSLKRQITNSFKAGDENDYGFLATVIMILLCIFLPPIAILIADGLKGPFWLDLLLCILAGGAYGLWGTTGGLLFLLAIIYAFIICF